MDTSLNLLITEAFLSAQAEMKNKTPKLRSARFVEEVGRKLHANFGQSGKLSVQEVDIDKGRKKKGEWLLDIAIAERHEVKETDHGSSKWIPYRLLWAVESEYSTSLEAMCDDLGKLLVVNSRNYLYLNGLNQQFGNTEPYVQRRLKTVAGVLNGLHWDSSKRFYYAFWPSPEKKGNLASLWDNEVRDLQPYIRVYEYRGSDFIRLQA